MRLQYCIILGIWLICSNCLSSLFIKTTTGKSFMKLNLIDQVDPSSLDAIQQNGDIFLTSLTNGFYDASGRLVGTIVAGVAVKTITDSIFEKMNAPKRREFNRNDDGFKTKTVEANAVVESKVSTNKLNIPLAAFPSLIVCILIDLAGDGSFLLPGVGEVGDSIWAPLSGLLTQWVLGSNVISFADFLKEALPFTDVIPIASLGWVLKNIYSDTALAKAVGLGPPNEEKKK